MWTKETFESLIGCLIPAHEPQGAMLCKLRVLDVIDLAMINKGYAGFSVIFESDQDIVSQGCVELKHDAYGALVLFVSPKSKNELEAIFN